MKRTAAESAITREAILEHALALFAEAGYHAARLESVAERAGVTRGAVYHHFGGKRALLLALVERYLGAFDAAVEEAIGRWSSGGGAAAASDPARTVESVIVAPLALLERDSAMAAFFELVHLRLAGAPELDDVREARRAQVDARLRALAEVMRAYAGGSRDPAIDPDSAARLVVALQHGLLLTWMELGRSYSLAEAAADAAKVFVRGLAAARGGEEG